MMYDIVNDINKMIYGSLGRILILFIIVIVVFFLIKLLFLSFYTRYITNDIVDILQKRGVIGGNPKEDYREDIDTVLATIEQEKAEKKQRKEERKSKEKEHD